MLIFNLIKYTICLPFLMLITLICCILYLIVIIIICVNSLGQDKFDNVGTVDNVKIGNKLIKEFLGNLWKPLH